MIYLSIYLYISFSILLLCLVNEKNGKAVVTLELKKWKEYIIMYSQIVFLSIPIIVLFILIGTIVLTILLIVMPLYFILYLIYKGIKNIFIKVINKLKGVK